MTSLQTPPSLTHMLPKLAKSDILTCSRWKTLILQACRNEPTILRFAVAISALDQACKEKDHDCMSRKPEEHHQYALLKYGNALKGVQKVISTRKNPLRIALIASLLIFCFENFHGDIQNAITNIKSAVEFMYSWLEKQAHNSKFKVFSPAPILVEDELVITFFRLARYMILFQGRLEDKYPKAKNSLDPFGQASPNQRHITNAAESSVFSIPYVFKNIVEAKSYWDPLLEYVSEYLVGYPHTNLLKSFWGLF